MNKIVRNVTIACVYTILLLSGCKSSSSQEAKIPETKSENNYQNINYSQLSPSPVPSPSPSPSPVPQTTGSKSNLSNGVLGSYATTIYDTDENRVHNIVVAAEDIDGEIIQPGETFSFNDTLGRRSKDKGYKKARIIVKGKKSYGTGGGVCQISTTLYNAALEANLEIVERHPHSKKVPYAPEGRDATVVYGSQDLKFKNNKSYPIRVNIGVSKGKVSASIVKAK